MSHRREPVFRLVLPLPSWQHANHDEQARQGLAGSSGDEAMRRRSWTVCCTSAWC